MSITNQSLSLVTHVTDNFKELCRIRYICVVVPSTFLVWLENNVPACERCYIRTIFSCVFLGVFNIGKEYFYK